MSLDWRSGAAYNEGRVDAEGDAIEIITIQSANGLEWPVVIPINTATLLRCREPFVHWADDDTLHWGSATSFRPSCARHSRPTQEPDARTGTALVRGQYAGP